MHPFRQLHRRSALHIHCWLQLEVAVCWWPEAKPAQVGEETNATP
jgi:hypothetical protein